LQYSVAVRNAGLNAKVAAIGEGSVLKVRTKAMPEACSSPDVGLALATVQLPADWMQPAENGQIDMSGVWRTMRADLSGAAEHFRIYHNDICHIQGSVGTGLQSDMQITNPWLFGGQPFEIERFTIVDNNG